VPDRPSDRARFQASYSLRRQLATEHHLRMMMMVIDTTHPRALITLVVGQVLRHCHMAMGRRPHGSTGLSPRRPPRPPGAPTARFYVFMRSYSSLTLFASVAWTVVQSHPWWTYNRSPVCEASEPKRVRCTAETSEQRRPTPRPRALCIWRLVNDLPMSCAGHVVARSSALPAARAPSPLDSSSFESLRTLMAWASRWHAHYCAHGRRRRVGLRHDRPPKPPAY